MWQLRQADPTPWGWGGPLAPAAVLTVAVVWAGGLGDTLGDEDRGRGDRFR